MVKLAIAPGVFLWREYFSPGAQETLIDTVFHCLEDAPLYQPVMPGTGKPFSVQESNFGALGWVSDRTGYRYQATHPVTGRPCRICRTLCWPCGDALAAAPPPQCCLVNLYRDGARMGLHQDRDENDATAPVIAVSLGDDALFRIGGASRGGPTRSVTLKSGDVVLFGGEARLAYHGIDRIRPGTSRLVPGGGRVSLTLRHIGGGHIKKPPARGVAGG